VEVQFFESSRELRSWLEEHHANTPELWVGFFKKSSGKPGISYQQALDEALCYGWIDGLTKRLDDTSYTVRFTPRRPRSNWSQVNIERVGHLFSLGLMRAAGLKAFEARDPQRSNQYSLERASVALTPEYEASFRENNRAWQFFESQPPSYRSPAMWWVMSAKREETRLRRLNTLIHDSASGRRLAAFTLKSKSETQGQAKQ
jgi:uncharacterized protein YdeI (YjbR/CyaY-like superfamily)